MNSRYRAVKFFSMMGIVAMLFFACGKKKNSLLIKGSDTLVNLTGLWAEDFLKKSNGKHTLSVTGGGSGTGIAALLNNTTDIAIASRKIKSKEMKIANKKEYKIKKIVVALDGVTVIVNNDNPVKKLTKAQLKDIYTGKITNWKKLGGSNLTIIIISRESSSGTYAFFRKKAMDKADYAASARRLPSNSGIVQTVSRDKGAIGYVGIGYYEKNKSKVRAVALAKTNQYILPTSETVFNGSYILSRGLNFYFNESSTSFLTKEFIDYVLSDQGQKLVAKLGFVSL